MNEVFKYRCTMTYIDSKRKAQEISMDNISIIVIDKDYENNNMPVITLSGMIDRKLRDQMIQEMDESIISLQLFKFNEFDDDNIGEVILNDIFMYMIEGDVSYSNQLDYNEGINDQNDILTKTTIFMLKRDTVNSSRPIFNFVNRNVTTTDLVMRVSAYQSPLLLEPIDNNKHFDEVIIPPLTSISEYLEYINDNLCAMYNSGYMYFSDYDTTYILSKSGEKVEHKKQRYGAIVIDIGNLEEFEKNDQGSNYSVKNRVYHIPIGVSSTKFTKNIVTKHIVTNVAFIDSSGNLFSKSLGNTTKNNLEKTKIFTSTTSNENLVGNIANNLTNNELIIDVFKNDLDSSLFTPNKEYIINNSTEHEEYNGRFLICSNKQVFIKEDNKFQMSTMLRFKKISQ